MIAGIEKMIFAMWHALISPLCGAGCS